MRIAGVDIPNEKRVVVALTYIYGIGPVTAKNICEKAGISPETRVKSLLEEQGIKLRGIIENEYKVEGELRTELSFNIKRLIDINCYRGKRHRVNLPVHGQRTRTNARTRKGPKKGRTVALGKGAAAK